MATQRVTIAKVGGIAADTIVLRLREWSAARQTDNPNLRSSEQWPQQVRREADDFADRLRAHGFAPPVVHFVEWVDMWSMGDLFWRWLTPLDGSMPLAVHADRFEIFAYVLPDGGRLSQHLTSTGPQQWVESDWFVGRLREAVVAWEELVDRAVVVVIREVVASSALDEEITASLKSVPDWIF